MVQFKIVRNVRGSRSHVSNIGAGRVGNIAVRAVRADRVITFDHGIGGNDLPTTETRQYRRRVVMLAQDDHTPVNGSYRSTLLRQDAPSKPPHTYNSPWFALMPKQLLFVPSDVTADHLLRFGS